MILYANDAGRSAALTVLIGIAAAAESGVRGCPENLPGSKAKRRGEADRRLPVSGKSAARSRIIDSRRRAAAA